jgi:hypothetical protein
VREASSLGSDTLSTLDLHPSELKRQFGLYCWVDKVLRVEQGYPNRAVVRLRYREPVAVPRHSALTSFLLDRAGVLLPMRDIDLEAVGGLIPIEGLDAPNSPHAGELLKTGDPTKGSVEPDRKAARGANLAAFLRAARESGSSADVTPAVDFIYVGRADGLYVKFVSTVWVFWNEAPGEEPPGRLTAEVKWAVLRDWFRRNGAKNLRDDDYLEFWRTGVVRRRGDTAPGGL